MRGRFPNWMLTWFPEGTDEEIYNEYQSGTPISGYHNKVMYAIWGLEKCPSTDKLHIHMYIEFTEKVSMSYIKDLLNNKSIHCEVRKGSQSQAIEYIKKTESKECFLHDRDHHIFKKIGEKKRQGNRTDLDTMVDAIENGMTGREILLNFRGNALRHINMIYRGLKSFHQDEPVDSMILMDRYHPAQSPKVDGNTTPSDHPLS